jgi:hypothetical protein
MVPSLNYSFEDVLYGYFNADDIITANNQAENIIKQNYPRLIRLNEDDNPVIVKVQVYD